MLARLPTSSKLMPLYADLLLGRRGRHAPPFPPGSRPSVIVTGRDHDRDAIRQLLPDGIAEDEMLHVRRGAGEADIDVSRLNGAAATFGEVASAVQAASGSVVLLEGMGLLPDVVLRKLMLLGARSGFVLRGSEWRQHPLSAGAALRLRWVLRHYVPWLARQRAGAIDRWLRGNNLQPGRFRRFGRQLRDALHGGPPHAAEWRRAIAAVRARPAQDSPARVTLYAPTLGSGGAERQHGNLALGLVERGFRVRVRTWLPLEGRNAHYQPLFSSLDIRQAGAPREGPRLTREQMAERIDPVLVRSLPVDLRDAVVDLAGDLIAEPADVLHCTLDVTNIAGGIAGLLAGVPTIVLSGRSVSPAHYEFYRSWMAPWYRFLLERPGVRFIVNSHAGAEDYARWLGIERSRIAVVLNGLNLDRFAASTDAIAGVRGELNATDHSPVVAGILRFTWEKQPLVFLDVIRRVVDEVPGLRVALVGGGPMEAAVRRRLRQRKLEDTVVMLGQRTDVAAIIGAADALLLTSAVEGTPNVVLESQWLNRPVVATAAGGTPDTIAHGETGFLHGRHDVSGMAASVVRLLRDPALRHRMGAAGHAFVRERFAMARMVDDTIAVYGNGKPAQGPAQ